MYSHIFLKIIGILQSIVTVYGLNGWGSIPDTVKDFCIRNRVQSSSENPSNLLSSGYQELFPENNTAEA